MTPVFCLDAGDAGGNLILIQIEDPSGHPEPDGRACANVLIPLRKLGVLGAIAGETRILDQVLIRDLGVSPEEVEAVIARETAERKRRERLFRSGPPLKLGMAERGSGGRRIRDQLQHAAAARHARCLRAASTPGAVRNAVAGSRRSPRGRSS